MHQKFIFVIYQTPRCTEDIFIRIYFFPSCTNSIVEWISDCHDKEDSFFAHTPGNVLLLCLACADFINGLVSEPFTVIYLSGARVVA